MTWEQGRKNLLNDPHACTLQAPPALVISSVRWKLGCPTRGESELTHPQGMWRQTMRRTRIPSKGNTRVLISLRPRFAPAPPSVADLSSTPAAELHKSDVGGDNHFDYVILRFKKTVEH